MAALALQPARAADLRSGLGLLTPMYNWLILVFGEALKTTDLSVMLLQHLFAGGGKECQLRPCFPYQKGWK